MTIIPAEIHARLSASERIRAAVSAMARGDTEELQTLKETCPKKSFLMTDPAYSEGMERLLALALAIEADLRGLALDFFMASRLEVPEAVQVAIGESAALETAWGQLLEEMGIPRHEISEAGPARHKAVEAILHIADGEEDAATVQACLESMREILAA